MIYVRSNHCVTMQFERFRRLVSVRDQLWNVITTLVLLLMSTTSHADSLASCFTEAGQRYGIAPALLMAIATTESSLDPYARHINTDGSSDFGLMQINSRWLSALKEYAITPADLWDPCLNIHVGAWVLAGNIQRYGYGWSAVGAYNAGTRTGPESERRRKAYAARVYRHLPCGHSRLCDGTARRD